MYILEGNIGAGKSTFLQLIERRIPTLGVALEPLHNWQKNVYGQSLLANFYQDPHRWSYSFETFAMICRVREHVREQEMNSVRLVERSIYSGHYCFVHTGYQNGFMSDLEWLLYQEWFNYLIPNRCLPPKGFIYLRTTPEIAYKRIKKRNRLAEKAITFAYLKQIHEQHERFLITKKDILPELTQVPVLVLDCDQDFEKNSAVREEHFQRVEKFIQHGEKI
ncbi:MAG: Deoxyadenosine/deoxycytidine kinase [Candidatus Dependentiae bacterium ADurb.Bin331]|nr:MAG: Deoxyadenosine/deoxycytidine kinase [Candidatus Dependentiae bacterium ADurb.Bin331]